MQKLKSFLILLICVTCVPVFGQDCSNGCIKLTKEVADAKLPAGKAKFVVKFFGPDGKGVKSNLQFVLGKDTLLAKVNSKGVYQIYVRPDVYKIKFRAPFWHVVKKENVSVKAAKTYFFTVKFEAKEIIGGKGGGKDTWD